MAKYTVTYERDEAGWWIAEVQGVAGVNSDGRTVADARRRVREALALAVGDAAAEAAALVDDVSLPGEARKVVARATAARSKLDAVQAEAQEARPRPCGSFGSGSASRSETSRISSASRTNGCSSSPVRLANP